MLVMLSFVEDLLAQVVRLRKPILGQTSAFFGHHLVFLPIYPLCLQSPSHGLELLV